MTRMAGLNLPKIACPAADCISDARQEPDNFYRRTAAQAVALAPPPRTERHLHMYAQQIGTASFLDHRPHCPAKGERCLVMMSRE
jgi:hypothetical protein